MVRDEGKKNRPVFTPNSERAQAGLQHQKYIQLL
jgi:hypothetical protein